MKYLISILFFAFTVNTFAANEVEPIQLEVNLVKDIVVNLNEVNEEKLVNISEDVLNTSVAFECNYTVEWLYNKCPFIERIVALA